MSYGALIAAGITAAAGVAQTASTGKLNKKNRQWQEDMWNKTNEYNTPQQQMQRFKAAGLNPHLIYGQGNSGNSSMPPAPKTESPDYSKFADAAQGYVTNRLQRDQITMQQKVAEAEIRNKDASTSNLNAQEENTRQDVAQKARLNPGAVTAQELGNQTATTNIAKIAQEIDKIAQDMKNNKNLSEAQIAKINAEIPKLKQEMQATAVDIRLKNLDGDKKGIENEILNIQKSMWQKGVNPNSSAGQSILKELYEASGLSQGIQWFKKQGQQYRENVWNVKP